MKEKELWEFYFKQIEDIQLLFCEKEFEFLGEVLEKIKEKLDYNFRTHFFTEFWYDIWEVDTSTFGFDYDNTLKSYMESVDALKNLIWRV